MAAAVNFLLRRKKNWVRALGFKDNGGPEVFEMIDVPEPVPGRGQVLIRVQFAGLNFAEVQHRRGEFGPPEGFDIPGLEVSGTIAALGEGVGGLDHGAAVAAYLPSMGGYAEYALAEAAFVRPVGSVLPEVAAGLPCVFPTAYGVLVDAGRLRAGDSVLIHAAAGGVGSAASQVAQTLGASQVFGTVGSPDKQKHASELGYDALFERDGFADAVLDATDGRGVDLVLDPVGGPIREASLGVLAPFGRVVVYGDLGQHGQWSGDVWDLWKNNKTIAGYNIGDVAKRSPDTIGSYLSHALDGVATGRLCPPRPVIAALDDAAEIHRQLESGATHGKIVLAVTS